MSTTLQTLQSLDVPTLTTLALVAAVVALVVSDPVLGLRDHRRLLAELATHGDDRVGAEGARVRFYRRWARGGWLWAAVAVALVTVLPGVGPAALGLRWPDLAGLGSSVWRGASPAVVTDGDGGVDRETAAGMLVGLLVGTLLVVVVLRVAARARAATRRGDGPATLPLAGGTALAPLLPTTPRGRRGWAALSVTAGVTEEVTYRGIVVLTLALVLPTAGPRVVVVLAAVVFGLAHAYQGPAGMVATGLAGAVFAGLYLGTGSLLVPMLLHVLVDLRVLLLTPRRTRDAVPGGAQPVGA
ncbi:CPBP family intramembrane glutamic endopeptidase [uncultured Cellulomonas sp.]|uniref:CPBP family intramembrane glutamic endopeptidase n=1 Tax=uncultured Cellulomonas sp. TaxID=189682 RepID=UPI0026320E12|nr:CPBP family intramembrane glutamic endopeptidase [uncultured Cellulomonas sp.]